MLFTVQFLCGKSEHNLPGQIDVSLSWSGFMLLQYLWVLEIAEKSIIPQERLVVFLSGP